MTSCRFVVPRLFLGLLSASLVTLTPLAAQQGRQQKTGRALPKEELTNARPGRDPNQPLDEEYTKKIKEYTTEIFFLSPLVDYLPASKTVPIPPEAMTSRSSNWRNVTVNITG